MLHTTRPIFIKCNRAEINNYRPVILTCVCHKIRDNLMKQLETNKLFSKRQSGFIKGQSTVTQLLKILDKRTECLDFGGQIDVIYTDLKKGF